MYKSYIEERFADRTQPGANTKTIAHSLSADIAESLSGNKYVNELLQNADDSGAHVEHAIQIEFIVTENYLICKHNGKPFDKDDVMAITDYASPYREKCVNIDEIGEKGKGFKSVFSIADYVLIVSNHWQFRFDKSFEAWRSNPGDIPWQITPIWTTSDDYPAEVKPYLSNDSVNFVLRIKSAAVRAAILIDVNAYLVHPNYLLFLKRTTSFTVTDEVAGDSNCVAREEKIMEEKENYKIKKIIGKTSQKKHHWLVCQADCTIADELQADLKKNEGISDKFRTLKTIPVSLAIEYGKSGLVQAIFPQVFCHLSTAINLNFPFYVNAKFFMEPSRAQLQDREIAKRWNGFLLSQIFYIQFMLLAYIGRESSYWKDVVDFVCTPEAITFGLLQPWMKSAKEHFDKGINEFQIITVMTEKYVVTVKKSQVDEFGFVQQFGLPSLQVSFAHPRVKNENKLLALGAKKFTLEDLLNEMSKSEFLQSIKEPSKNRQFIEYLFKLYQHHENNKAQSKQIEDKLKKLPFILSSKNLLLPLAAIYIPDDALMYCINEFEYIAQLHPVIRKLIEDKAIRAWLISLGLKPISLTAVVNEVNAHPKDTQRLTEVLFRRFDEGKLDKDDFVALAGLTLMTDADQFIVASGCYLGSSYQPTQDLQPIIANYHYVSLRALDETKIASWRAFLTSIGVSQTLNENNMEAIIELANQDKRSLIALTRLLLAERDKLNVATRAHFRKLFLVDTQGQTKASEGFYLSDDYRPAMPIQQMQVKLSFVSAEYLQERDDLNQWREFFISLGVRDSLGLKTAATNSVTELEVKSPWARKYFNYLSRASHAVDPVCGTKLCPDETLRYNYREQHTITYFTDIEFLDAIIRTPLFWRLIRDNFAAIRTLISETRYKTRLSSRKVISCIEYYVIEACREHYQSDPRDLYSPALRHFFADERSVAMVAGDLSTEQLAFLGFKDTVSLYDGIVLLKALSAEPCTQENFHKVTQIYQHIAKNLKQGNHETVDVGGDLKLWSRSATFVPVKELFFLNTRAPLPISKNSIKKPETMSGDDFALVCGLLGVVCVSEAELAFEPVEVKEDTSFAGQLLLKLPYIILFESYKHDILVDSVAAFIQNAAPHVLRKLAALKTYHVQAVKLSYGERYQIMHDYWFDANNVALYRVPNPSSMAAKSIVNLLAQYFELQQSADDLLQLLNSSEEDIHKYFSEYNINEANVSLAAQLIEVAKQQAPAEDDAMDLDTDVVTVSANAAAETTAPEDRTEEPSQGRKRRREQVFADPSSSSQGVSAFGGNLNFFSAPVPSIEQSVETPAKKARVDQDLKQTKLTDFSFSFLSIKDRSKIGYAGEKSVYDKLKQKYAIKYGEGSIAETAEGFVISKDTYRKEVKWPNKNRDPECPEILSNEKYDLAVITYGSADGATQTKTRYVEVKSTVEKDSIEANFSEAEWALRSEITPPNKYKLFCVTGVGSDQEDVKEVKRFNESDYKVSKIFRVSLQFKRA